jgi:hypothetical protein
MVMTDYSAIFSAPMITASREGRKHQTRRLAWRDCPKCPGVPSCRRCHGKGVVPTIWQKVRPGDRLWCREAWSAQFWNPENIDGAAREYWETPKAERTQDLLAGLYWREAEEERGGPFDFVPEGGWASPIHMPRWASRLTLVVTGARVEKLQEISEEDAKAEGVIPQTSDLGALARGDRPQGYISEFQYLWDHLHGSGAWLANPGVVALSFDPHNCNIDRMEKECQ